MLEIERPKIIQELQVQKINKPFVIVGLPAFNEEKTIGKVIIDAQKHADLVLVCDDGSTDMTTKIAKNLGAKVIMHSKNYGYGSAVASLFKRARELNADILVTLDADGQHNALELPKIIKPLIEKKADIVIGSRFLASKDTVEMPIYRQIGAKLITRLFNRITLLAICPIKYDVSDAQSGFRAYNRRAITQLNIAESGMGASVQILLNASREKLKIQEVPSSCKYTVEGETSTENPLLHGMGVVLSIFRFIFSLKRNRS